MACPVTGGAHDWIVPQEGDTALMCPCSRALDYGEIAERPYVRASIVKAVRARRDDAEHWMLCFYRAVASMRAGTVPEGEPVVPENLSRALPAPPAPAKRERSRPTEADVIAKLLEAGDTAGAVETAKAHLADHRARWDARDPHKQSYYLHLGVQGAEKRLADAERAHAEAGGTCRCRRCRGRRPHRGGDMESLGVDVSDIVRTPKPQPAL